MMSSQPPRPQGGEHSPGGSPSHGQHSAGQPTPGQAQPGSTPQPPPPPPSYGAGQQLPPPPNYGPPPGQQPPPGWSAQQAPGQPGPGLQQGWGQPQPGYGPPPPQGGWAPQPGYGQQPQWGQQPGYGQGAPWGGQPNPGPSAGSGVSFDLRRVTVADWVVAGCAILYLVWALLPWISLGNEFVTFATVSGFTWSGLVTLSFVLLLLAAAWAAVPAFTDLRLGFPRSWITVGLTGLAVIFTLIPFLSALKYNFSVWSLLALLTAVAACAFAVLRLVPELSHRGASSDGPSAVVGWANQPTPGAGQQSRQQQSAPGVGAPPPGYGQLQQHFQPQQYSTQQYPTEQHSQPQQYPTQQPYGQAPFTPPPGQQPPVPPPAGGRPPTRPQQAAAQPGSLEQHSQPQQYGGPQGGQQPPPQHSQQQQYAPPAQGQTQHYVTPPPPPEGEQVDEQPGGSGGGATASGEGESPHPGS